MSILSLFGINDALATTAPAAQPQSGGLWSMLPMLIIFVLVFYFLLIRPQAKRAKEHRKLIDNLNKGDEVLTSGGLIGRIAKIDNDFIVLTIADNVDITLQKAAIAAVLPKGSMKSAV
jgi:preprotein translocase subunit YajC